MSRAKIRIPRRYERPAELRPPLGDHQAEATVRASYTLSNLRRVADQRTTTVAVHGERALDLQHE